MIINPAQYHEIEFKQHKTGQVQNYTQMYTLISYHTVSL